MVAQFSIGNVVRLKSGGPKMTVKLAISNRPGIEGMLDEAIRRQGFRNGDLLCQWFQENELKEKAFPKDSVLLIPESKEE